MVLGYDEMISLATLRDKLWVFAMIDVPIAKIGCRISNGDDKEKDILFTDGVVRCAMQSYKLQKVKMEVMKSDHVDE